MKFNIARFWTLHETRLSASIAPLANQACFCWETLDEFTLGPVFFRQNGVSMLVNRRMAEISEIMCGKVLMTYDEFSGMLERRSGWLEAKNIYRLPDGSAFRYAGEELVTVDGECFRAAYFYDVTELVRRKKELETQNEELRRMSVQITAADIAVQLLRTASAGLVLMDIAVKNNVA